MEAPRGIYSVVGIKIITTLLDEKGNRVRQLSCSNEDRFDCRRVCFECGFAIRLVIQIVRDLDLILKIEVPSQSAMSKDLRGTSADEHQSEIHAERCQEKYRVVFSIGHFLISKRTYLSALLSLDFGDALPSGLGSLSFVSVSFRIIKPFASDFGILKLRTNDLPS